MTWGTNMATDYVGFKGPMFIVESQSASVAGRRYWNAVCQCGNKFVISTANINRGTKSCGCWRVTSAREHAKRNSFGGYKGYAKYHTYQDLLAETTPEGECLLWTKNTYKNGYAKIPKNSRFASQLGHRAVFHAVHGYLPTVVRHTCDVRNCINPKHLEGGTHRDNNMDRVHRKRDLHMRKLTESQVREIRKLHADGVSQRKLAPMFGVSRFAIYSIISHKTWHHLSEK